MQRPLILPAICLGLLLAVGRLGAAPFVDPRDAQAVAVSADGAAVAVAVGGPPSGETPPRPHPNPRKAAVMQLFNAQTGEPQWRREVFGDWLDAAFSPDGRLLAASRLYTDASDLVFSEVDVWDATSGKLLHRFERCRAFAFSPDGSRIAVCSRSKCTLFDTQQFGRIRRLEGAEDAYFVRFLPSGDAVVALCRTGGGVVLRQVDAQNGAVLAESPATPVGPYRFDLSADGRWLLTGHQGFVYLWPLQTTGPRPAAAGPAGPTPAAEPAFPVPVSDAVRRWTPIGRVRGGTGGWLHPLLIAGGDEPRAATVDQRDGTVQVWNLKTGAEASRFVLGRCPLDLASRRRPEDAFRPEAAPGRFALLPGGKSLLIGCGGGVVVDLAAGAVQRSFAE